MNDNKLYENGYIESAVISLNYFFNNKENVNDLISELDITYKEILNHGYNDSELFFLDNVAFTSDFWKGL